MVRKSIFLSIVVLVILVSCSNNSSSTAQEESGSEDNVVELTIGHILNEDHPAHLTIEEMAEELESRSDGTIKIDISSGGALGTENDMISQMQMGALDMVYIAGISMFESLDAKLGIEDVPFLFETKEDAYQALDGDYGKKVAEILEENNIHILSYWDAGYRHITNNIRPIEKPEDMKGINFRSSPIDLRLAMFEELDSTATPIDFNELFLGLQQGTVDGQENPLSLITSNKFYEVQDYLSLSGHILNAAQISIGTESLNKLSESQQQILSEVVSEYREVARTKINELESDYLSELEDAGMKINEVDKDAFRNSLENVEQIYIDANGDELIKLAK